ncbi:hypothetical protein APR42_12455 [Salegentibacter mishustinae]|uniref:Uncharacterized protein n=1 Tax=Salegentibacter mishustinae TaxID=270918 RepID=A0A0Q9ZCX1_9FLAO|nr:hypothetical protein APR42_12455 [Salegentibacter mishustinae]
MSYKLLKNNLIVYMKPTANNMLWVFYLLKLNLSAALTIVHLQVFFKNCIFEKIKMKYGEI